MKRKNIFSLVIAMIVLTISGVVTPTLALADSKSSTEDMAYSVKANKSDKQANKDVSYFDLQLKPSEQTDISVRVTNSGKKKSVFNLQAIHASTNKNGVIDYSNDKLKDDKSFGYKWNDIVSPKAQKVTLDPGKSTDVKFHIAMPAEQFSGIFLGGIRIQKQVDDSEKAQKGVMIRNRFAYVIGVSLHNDATAVIPDLKLNKVKPGLDNSYTVITANLQNPTRTIIHKFNVEAKIYKKGSKEVLYTAKKENMAMAPNSNFDFPISLNNDPIKPGKYTAKIHATSEDKKYEWNLGGDFTIAADKARSLNKDAVTLNKDYTWWIVLAVVIALLLIGLIIWLIIALKKKKKDEEEDNK